MLRFGTILLAASGLGLLSPGAVLADDDDHDDHRWGHHGWYHRDHSRFHDDLEHRDFHRELEHRNAHRYPMSRWQHGRLHDALEHDAFHDRLRHRRYHRRHYWRSSRFGGYGYPGYYSGRTGFGFSGRNFGIWIGR